MHVLFPVTTWEHRAELEERMNRRVSGDRLGHIYRGGRSRALRLLSLWRVRIWLVIAAGAAIALAFHWTLPIALIFLLVVLRVALTMALALVPRWGVRIRAARNAWGLSRAESQGMYILSACLCGTGLDIIVRTVSAHL